MDDFVYWDSIGGHVEDQARPANRQNGVRSPFELRLSSGQQFLRIYIHSWSSTEHNIPFSCCSKEFSKITGGSSCKTRLSFWLFAGILLLQVSHSFKRELTSFIL